MQSNLLKGTGTKALEHPVKFWREGKFLFASAEYKGSKYVYYLDGLCPECSEYLNYLMRKRLHVIMGYPYMKKYQCSETGKIEWKMTENKDGPCDAN